MKEKTELFNYCQNYVQQRIARIQEEIKRTQLSANEETKSSAGDKYETGRAMAQLEIERNMVQLKEAEKLNSTLQKIAPDGASSKVTSGSLVTTSNGIFYLAISLGLTKLNGKLYYIVSIDSPIGRLLHEKKAGDQISWNGSVFLIDRVD